MGSHGLPITQPTGAGECEQESSAASTAQHRQRGRRQARAGAPPWPRFDSRPRRVAHPLPRRSEDRADNSPRSRPSTTPAQFVVQYSASHTLTRDVGYGGRWGMRNQPPRKKPQTNMKVKARAAVIHRVMGDSVRGVGSSSTVLLVANLDHVAVQIVRDRGRVKLVKNVHFR